MIIQKNKSMKLNLNYFLLFTVILLTSCNSSKSIRLKDSSDSKKANLPNSGIAKKIENASIVHIDQTQRIITIRSNRPLSKGYYITSSQFRDQESSVIKLYDASYESIFIADILEGTPKITDSISRVSDLRVKELDAYYTEAIID